MTNIVIPLHHGGGSLGDDSELKFVLRSLETNFQGDFQVTIIGKKLPAWMDRDSVTHIQTGNGLKTAIRLAAEAYPEGFFWWYDDVILLKDENEDQLKVTAAKCKFQHTKTSWGRNLTKIHNRLKDEGHEPRDYSHSHGVYWFDKSMVDEGFADWPGMAGKFPWESWILSKRKWPWRAGIVKQFYGPRFEADHIRDSHTLLNFNGPGFSLPLREWLIRCFDQPSSFEAREEETSPENALAPMRDAEPTVSVEVHTIRTGSVWWLDFCAPTMDAWTKRHGHKLRIWTEKEINPAYPDRKFCEVDMLREFLAGGSDWMIYADADMYVDADAPSHPDLDKTSGMVVRIDLSDDAPAKWPSWCNERFPHQAKERIAGWTYINAGSWACDREAAARLLEVIEEPYHKGVQEQHHWNWWLVTAWKKGMVVNPLPKEWNQWPHENGRGAFYHLLGRHKARCLEKFRVKGLIPRDVPPKVSFTPVFDFEPYRFTASGNLYAMDEAHIQLLHLTAQLVPGGVAMEIGSYRGASTSALVEAVNRGWLSHLHVAEPRLTPELKAVVARCNFPGRVTLHTKPSWELQFAPPDFVFIDGDHEWPAVADTLRALTWGAKVIAMHDSCSFPEFKGTWGAKLAADLLKQAPGRVIFEDAVRRKGAHTHRGFLVSAQEGIDLEVLRQYKIEAQVEPKPELPKLEGKQFVLARYRENVSWTDGLDAIVYDKSVQPVAGSRVLPNVGFEAQTYLHHFAEHYADLAPVTICLQAEPFEHLNFNNVEGLRRAVASIDPDKLSFFPLAKKGLWVTAGGGGKKWRVPAEEDKIAEMWRSILGYPPPGLFHFWQGAQFAVSRSQVHRRPREFYANAAKIVETKIDALILETMWGHIFS
jgi:hypothetical protein